MRARILPDDETEAFAYDAAGRLTLITPPNGDVHTFAYDATGRLASYTAPSVGSSSDVTTYTYDADAQVASVLRADGSLVAFDYDDGGHVTTITHPGGSVSIDRDSTTGSVSRLTAADGGEVVPSWDGSLLLGETWTGDVAGAVSYEWDDDLRIASISVASGDVVDYVYDDDGFVESVGDMLIDLDVASGDTTGTVLAQVETSVTLDTFGELSDHSASVSGATLWTSSLIRDDLGRILSSTETIQGDAHTSNYTYDSRGRLASATLDGDTTTWTYEANGNRTEEASSTATASATYDAQDRLVSFATSTYVYADSGELESMTTASGTTSYTYDALGNLLAVSLPSGSTIEYLVDGENRRIGRKVDGVLERGFLYAGALHPITELDAAGTVVSTFVFGTRSNVPDYMIRDGRTYRILSDTLGSPRLVVDVDTGDIAQRLDYDPWGNVTSDTNAGFQPFGFAGGLYDSDTGLVRFGARDYDAESGRWTAKDPIGFGGATSNLYTYAGNDPVNGRDPSGLAEWGGGYDAYVGNQPYFLFAPDVAAEAGLFTYSPTSGLSVNLPYGPLRVAVNASEGTWAVGLGRGIQGIGDCSAGVTGGRGGTGAYVDVTLGKSAFNLTTRPGSAWKAAAEWYYGSFIAWATTTTQFPGSH